MLPSDGELAPCPDCGGRGWIVEPDGGAGTARPCECRRRHLGRELLAAAEIPQHYRGCRLSNFNVKHGSPQARDQRLRACAISERYVAEFLGEEGGFRQTGLIYVGPPGVGKTHLAVAVLMELIERYHVRGRFVDFTSLIDEIQATFDPGTAISKREILSPVMNAQILVLDELGAQKPSPWVNDILYLIMNARYTRRLPTLFTTNYRLESPSRQGGVRDPGANPADFGHLASRISPMLLSRLYEMAQPVDLNAVDDFRQSVKMPQRIEA